MPDPKFVNPNPGFCRECGEDISALGRMRQYCDEHRPEQKKKAPPSKAAKRATTNLTTTPVRIAKDVADAALPAGGGRGGGAKKAPTVDQTSKVFGRILMYVTILIAMRLVQGDPGLPSDEAREAQAQELQLDEAEATRMIRPLARFVTPLGFWRSYGGHIIENADIIDCIAALYDYFSSVAKYSAQRKQRIASTQPQLMASRPAPPAGPAPQHSNGNYATEEPESYLGQGRVMSRSDIQAMRRGEQ